jgi:hypothetical protein
LQECQHRKISERLLRDIWHCVFGEYSLVPLQLLSVNMAIQLVQCLEFWHHILSMIPINAEWRANVGSCWSCVWPMSLRLDRVIISWT